MDETKRLGEVLPAITETAATEVETLQRTFTCEELSRLNFAKIPDRLTDAMIAKLEGLAAVSIPAPAPCRESEFFKAMATLRANMPSQNRDDAAMLLQSETYYRMLGGYTKEQIERMVAEALDTCEFFPTIMRCKEILERIPDRNYLAEKRDAVLARIAREKHARYWDLQESFKAMMTRLSREPVPQDEIDAMRLDWIDHAFGYGYLRKSEDGGYVQGKVPGA